MAIENNKTNSPKNNPIHQSEEVQKSKDQNIDKDFPGYPHYPAREDIMNPQNHTERVVADVDSMSKADLNRMHLDNSSKTNPVDPARIEDQEDLGIIEGTEADVTKEDLEFLGDRDLDFGEDEIKRNKDFIVEHDTEDVEAVDEHLNELHTEALDIPEGEFKKGNIISEQDDEENSFYSLGGDRKD